MPLQAFYMNTNNGSDGSDVRGDVPLTVGKALTLNTTEEKNKTFLEDTTQKW